MVKGIEADKLKRKRYERERGGKMQTNEKIFKRRKCRKVAVK